MRKLVVDIAGFNERLLRRTGSAKTVRAYTEAIRKFEAFSNQTLELALDQVVAQLKSEQLDIYRTLDKFVGWLNVQGLMPATVTTHTTAMKTFFRYHDIEIVNETMKMKVVMPTADQIPDVPIERQTVRKILISDAPLQMRCAVAVQCSAGTRIGETCKIRVKDIHFDEDPVRVEIRKENVKATKHGRFSREVFITPEAAELVKQYVEQKRLGPDDRLFGYTAEKVRATLRRWLPKWGLGKKIEGHPYYQIHPHIFRKYFFTNAVGPMGEVATHAMMGHNFYLKTYYARPLADRQADYKKAIPSLSVLQGTNEEQLRKKLALDQLRLLGLPPDKLTEVEAMMTKAGLFVPDEAIQQRIRELLLGAWGRSTPPNAKPVGVW